MQFVKLGYCLKYKITNLQAIMRLHKINLQAIMRLHKIKNSKHKWTHHIQNTSQLSTHLLEVRPLHSQYQKIKPYSNSS